MSEIVYIAGLLDYNGPYYCMEKMDAASLATIKDRIERLLCEMRDCNFDKSNRSDRDCEYCDYDFYCRPWDDI